MIATLLLGCRGMAPPETDTGATVQTTPDIQFPLPPDIATTDWVSVFTDAANLMLSVNTQAPWAGHLASIDARQPGCPDFWTDQFTDNQLTVGIDGGVSWYDDCETDGGLGYAGYVSWESSVVESGDPTTVYGRTSDASRRLIGNGIVTDPDGVKFEFNGTASDSFYDLEAYGYNRFVYSSALDATVTGRDAFPEGSITPDGWRSDLVISITGGDVQNFTARGDVYLFTPQLQDRFDSIEVDMDLQGALGAPPGECLLEPLGWIGVRDPDANWYDVVFQPRHEETITGTPYTAPQSACDGCGTLYVQGVEQDIQVCLDFSSFVFDNYVLPNPDDYVLPFHSL
jgi:hypothetical protein